jgi:hypothetical protein
VCQFSKDTIDKNINTPRAADRQWLTPCIPVLVSIHYLCTYQLSTWAIHNHCTVQTGVDGLVNWTGTTAFLQCCIRLRTSSVCALSLRCFPAGVIARAKEIMYFDLSLAKVTGSGQVSPGLGRLMSPGLGRLGWDGGCHLGWDG